MKRLTKDEVECEILALDTLDTKALQVRWRSLYKRDPPRRVRAGFLRRGIAYRLRELAYGGLKPETVRLLRKLAAELRAQRVHRSFGSTDIEDEVRPHATLTRPILSPGTQLLREWNGATEMVEVTTEGFIWRSKPYRTLSAVAVAITGTKWSGPKFFGLLPPPLPVVTSSQAGKGQHAKALANDSQRVAP